MPERGTMRKIKTDTDLVEVARRIDAHLDAIRNLIYDLEDAEHPGAKDFLKGLNSNGLTAFAWAEHIVHTALKHPDQWETGNYGIHRIHKSGDG
jgi:hypothetical protein